MRASANVVLLATVVGALGCLGGSQPGLPAPADSISPEEFRRELPTVHGLPDLYPVGLALVGGGIGAFLGWHAGCTLGIGGGDDPGLEGCVYGAAGGAFGGIIVGANVGGNLAADWRRDEAIRRIKERRRQSTVPRATQ